MAEIDDQIKVVSSQISEVDQQIARLKSKRAKLLFRKNALEEEKVSIEAAKIASQNWNSPTDFPWSSEIHDILKSRFKLASFRPLQLSAINATLSGNDVMVIMPTGGGKSLIFQLPSLVTKAGFTLVVSPLVSLMEDQVISMKKLDIQAEMLSASTSKADVTRILNAMIDSKSSMRMLYVTPEKLSKSKRFMAKLQKAYAQGLFKRLAIDEVHCCSVWGHDFRPDYKFLGVVRNLCPDVPILGLTATSTQHVTDDVKKILSIQKCLVFKAPLNRANLFYEVRPKPDNQKDCLDVLEKLLKTEFKGQSGIIYTLTIKDVETMTQDLRSRGVRVGCYHANLEPDYRSAVHKKWLEGSYQAVIATIAFGMGIDKPDVRFVIHHCMSKSMENFYQESGRAGRDDSPSKCILFYKFSDISRLSTMVFTEQTGLEKLYGIVSYGLDKRTCRRKIISDHFGEKWDSTQCNSMCDNCKNEATNTIAVDISEVAEAAVRILVQAQSLDAKVTALKLVDALMSRGAGNLKLKDWTRPVVFSERSHIEHIVAILLMEGQLREDFHFTPYSTISYILPGRTSILKPMMRTVPCKVTKTSTKRPTESSIEKPSKVSKPDVVYLSDNSDSDFA